MPPSPLARYIQEKDVNPNRSNLLRLHEQETVSQLAGLVHRPDKQQVARAKPATDKIGYDIVKQLKLSAFGIARPGRIVLVSTSSDKSQR